MLRSLLQFPSVVRRSGLEDAEICAGKLIAISMHRAPPRNRGRHRETDRDLIQKCLSAGDTVAAFDFAEVGIFRWQLSTSPEFGMITRVSAEGFRPAIRRKPCHPYGPAAEGTHTTMRTRMKMTKRMTTRKTKSPQSSENRTNSSRAIANELNAD